MSRIGTLLIIIATATVATAIAVQKDVANTTPRPMHPCGKEILFGIDATWMDPNYNSTFSAVKLFLTSNLVQDNWTNFDRIALRFWAKNYTSGPEAMYNKTDFDNAVNKAKKIQSPPSIEEGLKMLSKLHPPTRYSTQMYVMFTTSSDPIDVQNALFWAYQMSQRLIVVAVSPASRQNLLPLLGGQPENLIVFNPNDPETWDGTADHIRNKLNFDCGDSEPTTTTFPFSTTSSNGCVDTIANCGEYSASCTNGLYQQFMCMYCKKTCGLCNGQCLTL